MSWQERLIKTETAKELYNILEPILKKRTADNIPSLYGIFLDLETDEQKKELLELVKNNKNLSDNDIMIKTLEIDFRDNPPNYDN